MSGRKTSSDDVKRWKDKCFAQADELEEQEKSFDDYVGVLQRLLVRVSLAAEGLNDGLDEQLTSLRDLLRKDKAGRAELASRLEKIETAVLELDEQKSERTEKVLDALESLVDQLLELDLERQQKKQLKQLSKEIKSQKNGLKEYPNLLLKYARLQEEALKIQLSGAPKEAQGGFLKRLLGSTPKEVTPPNTDPQEADDAVSLLLSQATELDITRYDSPTETTVDNAEDGDGEFIPGFSAISGHVSSALNNLIEQLTIPTAAESTAKKVQNTIRGGLNWYELGPTIDDVANLVISAVGKGQKDFENFLQSLDGRLAKLQGYLSESQVQQLDWQGSSSELDEQVREQVLSISKEVENSNDIDHLKVSVSVHLDTIISSMDNFVSSEDSRVDEMNKQMEVMQHRLVAMETEAGEIRARLKVERTKALTDVLTGLSNREAYEERLQMEFERWKRYRQPAAIVVGDIDLFKNVNDSYGHLAGDKVIQIIAKEIANRIRKTDFVARYGGEEFVIILPETKIEDVMPVMEKAREMISRLPFHFRDEEVQITMSFGVAAFQDKSTAAEVFDLADKALYKAKENGRNRVELYDPDA